MLGLQVSACTGNARRVSLRCVAADNIPKYWKILPPLERWKTLRDTHGMLDSLRGNNFSSWIQNLPSSLGKLAFDIVQGVFRILEKTGLSQDGKTLVLS